MDPLDYQTPNANIKFITDCLNADKAKAVKSNNGLQHVNGFYNHFHNISNDLAGLSRASKMMSEIWYTFSYNVTLAFSSTKFLAIVSVPGDTIDCIEDVQNVFKKDSSVEKGVHGIGALAAAGNVTANIWTFLQGLDAVVSISQPALQFFDAVGPVGWGLNTLTAVKGGYRVYEDGKVLRAIEQTKPADGSPIQDSNHYEVFKLFLLDGKGHKITHSDLMGKLRLMDRFPGLESKYKIRSHVETLAKGYMMTADTVIKKQITNKFVGLVQRQYRMNQVFLALKVVALVAGLGALLFFYIPALSHLGYSKHLAWSLLILGGTVCVASAGALKINALLFMRDLKKQSEPLEQKAKDWEKMAAPVMLLQEAYKNAISKLEHLRFDSKGVREAIA